MTRGKTTHIIAGSTKLNDHYFNLPQYSGESWAQLVACQEIGHDYGLGHQDENFNTDLTTSCMDYTSAPAWNAASSFATIGYPRAARWHACCTARRNLNESMRGVA